VAARLTATRDKLIRLRGVPDAATLATELDDTGRRDRQTTWVDQRHDQLLELAAVLTAPEHRELATDETYEELLTLDRAHQTAASRWPPGSNFTRPPGLATSPDVAAQPADHPLRVALATVTSLHKDYRRHIGNNHHH
jgi:hypothetical protein